MIGAVIAMKIEAQILLDGMDIKQTLTVSGKPVYIGRAFGKEVALIICGVGKVNAALGAQALIDLKADKLFNFGVAGGLNERTELCGVYQIEKAVQYDFDLTQLNGGKIGTLDEYDDNYLSVSTFTATYPKRNLGSGDRFNDSANDYRLLTKELGADIRDMEGGAVAQVACEAKIPVYLAKAISDVAGSGSTTDQYLLNRARALDNLKAALPELFKDL
jgi:adenosylhomocysteine nucleosidase